MKSVHVPHTGAAQRRNVVPKKKIRQLITKCELMLDRRERNLKALEGWGMKATITLNAVAEESIVWMLDRYAHMAKGHKTLLIDDIVIGFSDMKFTINSTELKKALKMALNGKGEGDTFTPTEPSVICAVCCTLFMRLTAFAYSKCSSEDLAREVLRLIGETKGYVPDIINGKADE